MKNSEEELCQRMDVTSEAYDLVMRCRKEVQSAWEDIDAVALDNTAKVLHALQEERVAAWHFAPSTGYGYDDAGRDTLARVFARAFHAEDALVRPQFSSGTHAISTALWGLLEPKQTMLSASGTPYDTLRPAIGIDKDDYPGSLSSYGIVYREEALINGRMNLTAIEAALRSDPSIRVLYIQRSRGYEWREAFSIADIEKTVKAARAIRPEVLVVVDNCYGEFVERQEPTDVGADVMIGSLIKNPGGGIAPTGSYIVGTHDSIERIAARMTAPGIGREVGSYAASYAPFYQGFFQAPHVVAEALKTAVLAARLFERLGYETSPASDAHRSDIIQAVSLMTPEALVAFCEGIQAAAPVDSYVKPEPWDMPGYNDPVIMAAGAFVQGASIELSADGPMREPYIAYMQGGLHIQHGTLALMKAATKLLRTARN